MRSCGICCSIIYIWLRYEAWNWSEWQFEGVCMKERQMDLVEVLSFFFMLSTMELGRVRPESDLSRIWKADLRSGLLHGKSQWNSEGHVRRPKGLWARLAAESTMSRVECCNGTDRFGDNKASSRRFSPTRLATTLTSSLPPLPNASAPGSSQSQGFIILETNYRLYAYTGMRLINKTWQLISFLNR